MDELRRIRATFERYRSLRGNWLYALLGGGGVLGSFTSEIEAVDRATPQRWPDLAPLALDALPGLVALLGIGVLIWLGWAPRGRVIDREWRSSEPSQAGCLGAIALLLLLLAISVSFAQTALPAQMGYGVGVALLAGGLAAFLSRRYRHPLAALLCAVAVALPTAFALLTGGRYQPSEQAFADSLAMAGFVYGSFGSVYLRRLLRPLSRPAFDALSQADLPPALRSPDALAVLAALSGCRAADPLLLQRLSHGSLGQVLAELADAGLAEVDGPRDSPQRGMASATAAGRQTIAALIG